jgi:hypothetical protein
VKASQGKSRQMQTVRGTLLISESASFRFRAEKCAKRGYGNAQRFRVTGSIHREAMNSKFLQEHCCSKFREIVALDSCKRKMGFTDLDTWGSWMLGYAGKALYKAW